MEIVVVLAFRAGICVVVDSTVEDDFISEAVVDHTEHECVGDATGTGIVAG